MLNNEIFRILIHYTRNSEFIFSDVAFSVAVALQLVTFNFLNIMNEYEPFYEKEWNHVIVFDQDGVILGGNCEPSEDEVR